MTGNCGTVQVRALWLDSLVYHVSAALRSSLTSLLIFTICLVDGARDSFESAIRRACGRLQLWNHFVGNVDGRMSLRRNECHSMRTCRAEPRPSTRDSSVVPAALCCSHSSVLGQGPGETTDVCSNSSCIGRHAVVWPERIVQNV